MVRDCEMKYNTHVKIAILAFLPVFIVAFCFWLDKYEHSIYNHQIIKTKRTIDDLAQHINEIRLKTGRFPANESDLIKLIGKPLPLSAWNTPIEYSSTNDSYRVETVAPYPSGILIQYDSLHQSNGAVAYPF